MLSFSLLRRFWSLFLTLSFSLATIVLSAQVTTYNKSIIFTEDSIDERCSGVVDVSGRQFITCGFTLNEGYRIGVAEIDSLGNKVWTCIIGDSANNYSLGWNNGLNKTSDGHLILTGRCGYRDDSTGVYYPRTFLMKLSCEGELIWKTVLNDSMYLDHDTYGEAVIETYNHGFVVIGQIGIMGILYYTDSIGNVQWYKTFGSGETTWYEYLSSVEELPDHGFIVGSYGFNGHLYQSGDPLVYRLNETGAILWKKSIGGPYPDDMPSPLIFSDSVLLVLAPYTTKAAWFGMREEVKLRVLKMAVSSGQILLDTMYGDIGKLYVPSQIRRVNDGTIVGCGTDIYATLAWLFCFNEHGDSLFLREYSYSPTKDRYDTLRDLHGCTLCSDGGFLSVGTYYPVYRGEYRGNGWLLKTDRYGCLETGCDSNGIYIVDQPAPITLCRDQSATLSVTTLGGDPYYQWQVLVDSLWEDLTDTSVYYGIDSSAMVIDLSGLTLPCYSFRVKIYNDLYELYSEKADVNILDTVSFLLQPQDQFVRRQDTAIFMIHTAGMEPQYYQWYKDGEIVHDRTYDTLVISSVNNSDTGSYFCRVYNDCGQEDSQIGRLSINYTSVGSVTNDPVVLCSPNPFTEFLFISVLIEENKETEVKIIDITGKILYNRTMTGGNNHIERINLPGLDKGLYFLAVSVDNNLYLKKILKY